jgi:hypothetical protein
VIGIVVCCCQAATDSRFLRALGIPACERVVAHSGTGPDSRRACADGFSPIRNTPVLLHDNDEFVWQHVLLEGHRRTVCAVCLRRLFCRRCCLRTADHCAGKRASIVITARARVFPTPKIPSIGMSVGISSKVEGLGPLDDRQSTDNSSHGTSSHLQELELTTSAPAQSQSA